MKTLALIAHDHKQEGGPRFLGALQPGVAFHVQAGRHATHRTAARGKGRPVGGDGPASMPHDPDIRALMRVCNVRNVPLATNLAAADLIITGFGVLNQP